LLSVYANSASGAGSGSELWLGWSSPSNAGGGITIGGVYNGSGTDILFSTPETFSSAPTEKVRIDSSGRLLVGTSSRYLEYYKSGANYSGSFCVTRAVWDAVAQFSNWQNTNGEPTQIMISRSRGGAIGSHSVLSNGDGIGALVFNASDGSAFRTAALIEAATDGTSSIGDVPGRLVFSTTADGASSPTERMRITSDGYIRLAAGTGGIQFNGDTAAANALDDYEEGTWTPVIANTGYTYTYSDQTGTYTKVGRKVTLSWRVVVTARSGAATGGLPIVVIPFAASASFTGSPASAPNPAQLVIHKADASSSSGIRTFLYSGLANGASTYFWIAAIDNTGNSFDFGPAFYMGGVFTYEV